MTITRRLFVQTAIATSAARGFAGFTRADDKVAGPPDGARVIDTHVYIGDWPHKRLPNTSAKELAATLRSSNVLRAWVGSFDGLFYKDIGDVNERLAADCRELGDGLLIPFGAVNPALPDWEQDVRRCHEDHHMPGIRLHPQYHGYTLNDPRFASLLAIAAARGLVVQLVAWMEDEKHRWLSPEQSEVDLKPLPTILGQVSNLQLVIANCRALIGGLNRPNASPKNSCYYDFAGLRNGAELRKLVNSRSADHLVVGSGAPLHNAAQINLVLGTAELHEDQLRSIATGNAAKLVNLSSAAFTPQPR